MITEYLLIINTKDNCCTNKVTFGNLLKTNSKLSMEDNKIIYDNTEFIYSVQTEKVANDNQYRYFHLKFEVASEEDEILKKYEEMLRAVRVTVGKFNINVEVLWDDLSMYYAKKAYPMIFKIENLMRKLLTKFMIVNVGRSWEKESVPAKILNMNRNRKDDLNKSLLYQLDFIDLATFLFDEYEKGKKIKLKDLIRDKDIVNVADLDEYIPLSNWERYFNNIVSIEKDQLKILWEKLYTYRCKIAHNKLFKREDYIDTQNIINEIEPRIKEAIDKLSEVKVEPVQVENILETYAIRKTDFLGDFLRAFNKLVNYITEQLEKRGVNFSGKTSLGLIDVADKEGMITHDEFMLIRRIIYFRNSWVHMSDEPKIEEVKNKIEEVNGVILQIRKRLEKREF